MGVSHAFSSPHTLWEEVTWKTLLMEGNQLNSSQRWLSQPHGRRNLDFSMSFLTNLAQLQIDLRGGVWDNRPKLGARGGANVMSLLILMSLMSVISISFGSLMEEFLRIGGSLGILRIILIGASCQGKETEERMKEKEAWKSLPIFGGEVVPQLVPSSEGNAMAKGKLILICQSGGDFVTNEDGTLSYDGGEANAVNASFETLFDDLKLKLAELCNLEYTTVSIKYFLPGNRRILITIKHDKDLKRMFEFHGNSVTADIFVMGRTGFDRAALNMHASRETGIKVAETVNRVVLPTTAAKLSPVKRKRGAVDKVAAHIDSKVAAEATSESPTRATTSSSPSSDSDADEDSDYISRSAVASRTKRKNTTEIDLCATPADTVKKRRRTASWKIGANGPTIVAVTDDAGGRRSRRKTSRSQSIAAVADETERKQAIVPSKDEFDSPLPIVIPDDVALEKLIASWRDGISGVGQEFKSVNEFRDALQKYAIAHRFVYKLKKNDTNRASGICVVDGCSWRIHASWVPTTRSFQIKKLNTLHSCDGESWKSAHPTKNWLVSIIKDKLRDSPHLKPKEIAKGISRDFGIELSYTQVWRGIEDAREQLQGSYKEAYNRLPSFLEKIGPFNGDGKASLPQNLLAAAYAVRPNGFKRHMEEVKQISSQAYDWVMQIEPENWTSMLFKGEPYNEIIEDVAESYIKLMEDVWELTIIQKIEALIGMMIDITSNRRLDLAKWSTKLAPSKEKKLQEESLKGRNLQVLFSSDTLFEVRDDSSYVVNIDKRECSCLAWKETGLPCCHAIAVFNCTGRSVYDYCSRYFTVESFRLTYSESINPVPRFVKSLEKEEADSAEPGPGMPIEKEEADSAEPASVMPVEIEEVDTAEPGFDTPMEKEVANTTEPCSAKPVEKEVAGSTNGASGTSVEKEVADSTGMPMEKEEADFTEPGSGIRVEGVVANSTEPVSGNPETRVAGSTKVCSGKHVKKDEADSSYFWFFVVKVYLSPVEEIEAAEIPSSGFTRATERWPVHFLRQEYTLLVSGKAPVHDSKVAVKTTKSCCRPLTRLRTAVDKGKVQGSKTAAAKITRATVGKPKVPAKRTAPATRYSSRREL
ncbi:hypothetical protein RJ639_024811 [Escallonia herrerae]|uniref:SWIM-type domain-containing protein n=1 Tax=Escallonia herrerae TaxID=1293975 RepID=A0AA88UXZ5_9ASTE|nr:hypothetical protein RJ639_024811 [Escallonia herrerae]